MSEEKKQAAWSTAQLVLTVLNIVLGAVVVIGGPIWLGRQLERFDLFTSKLETLSSTVADQARSINALGQEDIASRKDREHISDRLTRVEQRLDRLVERRNPNS